MVVNAQQGGFKLVRIKYFVGSEVISEAGFNNTFYNLLFRDRTRTVTRTVPAWNNVGSVQSQNIFCSGAGTC